MTQNGIILVVSVSIIKDEEVLIIKENKPSDMNKWNFPSGRIEHKEDILNAACREVKEETGYDIILTGTTGIYNFISNLGDQVILFHFIGEITGGSLKVEEEEIVDSKWIKVSDFIKFHNIEIRNPRVIKQITRKILDRKFHPLTIFNEQLCK